jgi:transposase-like protein
MVRRYAGHRFQSVKTANATIKGFEVMRMFRKGQFKLWIEAVGGGTASIPENRTKSG